MKRDNYYNYIDEQLHILTHRITTNGKLNMLRLHLHSENFYLHFFNLLYGYNLINLNDVSQNVEAIDLIDHDKKIMIQVSSTSTKQKIESALSKDTLKEYAGYRFKFISIAKDATDLRDKIYKNPHSIIFDPKKDIYDIRSFLNSISSLDIDKMKDVYVFIEKELGEGSKNRFDSNVLKEKYLKSFNTISLLTTDTPKPIDEIFVNLAIIKEKKEEKSKDKTINREALLSSYEEIHKLKESIEIKELVNKSNKSLIYGKAGIGKTTLCKYISYKWAKGELYNEFEYLIYIPLREWKSDSGIKGAIRDYYYSLDIKDISIDFDANKTLFLFDGYDELDGDKKKILRDEIEHYHLSHYIITTRPYGYQQNDFRVDEYFETIGFTDENVTEYIDNFFDQEKEKSEGLKIYFHSNISMKHIGYMPLMLEMICSLWEQKKFGSDMSMTELYSQVIENILKEHSANKDDERVYKRQNRKKIKEQLAKLAFEGLTQQTILFDGDFIEDSIDDIEFFEENTIYSGFLKSDTKEKDLLDNSFEFPHLTFQEYFSALYVSKLEPQEQSEIIRDWKFYPHMQIFFAFLGGLIEDKVFFLREIRESKPKNLVGFYIFLLIFDCLNYINKKDVNKFCIQYINNILIQWVTYLIEKNYKKSILDKLYQVIIFLEDVVVNTIIAYINNEKIDLEIRKDLVFILPYLHIGKDKNKIINTLNLFLTNKNIDTLTHLNIIGRLAKFQSKGKEKYIPIHMSFDSFSFGLLISSKEIIEVLMSFNYKNNSTMEHLITILRNQNFNEFQQGKIAKILASIHKNKKIDNLIEFIEDESIDFYIQVEVFEALIHLKKVDKQIIDKFSSKIKDKNLCDNEQKLIAKPLAYLAKNKKMIDELIDIIKDNDIYYYVRRSIAKEFANEANFIKEMYINILFPSILIENTSITILFQLLDDDFIGFDLIFKNISYKNTQPLYLKNNKLHTIENGKEISTQREVDEATFNEIKILLEGDDLDD